MIIADSWIWVEYFRGTKNGKILEKFLKTDIVVTPNIVLLELASKYIREGHSKKDLELRLKFIVAKTTVVEFDYKLAINAAECLLELRQHARKIGLKKKPGIADALILAIARKLGGKILTGDKHFMGLDDVIFVGESNK